MHQPAGQGPLGVDAPAPGHHIDGQGHADQTWQPLGASGAGHQAEGHLGQPQFGVGGRQAVVARQRNLQAPTQGRAVHQGDHRLAAGLDHGGHIGQGGPLRQLRQLAEVGAGYEGSARTHQADGRDLGVHERLGQGIQQTLAHRLVQRVHRWMVDADDGEATVTFIDNRMSQRSAPLCCVEKLGGAGQSAGLAQCVDQVEQLQVL